MVTNKHNGVITISDASLLSYVCWELKVHEMFMLCLLQA